MGLPPVVAGHEPPLEELTAPGLDQIQILTTDVHRGDIRGFGHHGSDPQIVGKPIRFAELATTISGVAPKNFDTPHGTDFWAAIRAQPDDVGHSQEGYLRVKPGTNPERLHGEMASVMAGLAKDFPASDLNRIYVTARSADAVEAAQLTILNEMRIRHEIAPGDPDDVMVQTQATSATATRSPRCCCRCRAARPA